MVRYLIALGADPAAREHLRSEGLTAGLSIVLDHDALLVLTDFPAQTIRCDAQGSIIGTLYARETGRTVRSLPARERELVILTEGKHLVEHYWGDYIALMQLAGGVKVLRSPFGALPCLYRTGSGYAAIASDIETLRIGADRAWSIDYSEVARQLMLGDLRGRQTCLQGVREVRGGETAQFRSGSPDHQILWSPWDHLKAGDEHSDLHEAAEGIREQAIRCIQAKTQGRRCLVMLSGGLDSSIVAASLSVGGHDFACLNLVAPAAAGDERVHARAVARHLNLELAERQMTEGSMRLDDLVAAALPRPVARSFEQRLYREAGQIADDLGCNAIVDGGGGDSVFCSLQSASPAADCLLDRGNWRAFWHSCNEIADLTHASTWRVARKAVRRAWERSRPYRWPVNGLMLSREAKALIPQAIDHPWLVAGSPPRPGQSARMAQLIGAQSFVEDGPHGAKSNVLSPLVSQPLVERCLSVPPWQWIERGCNRALARRAYAPLLPPEIAWRRSKGIPDSYIVKLFEANRKFLRETLLGGLLAAEKVIDTAAVEAALNDPTPFRGQECSRIVRLADTEMWARGITG